jgi:uncharacterized protein (TIGR02118 family)
MTREDLLKVVWICRYQPSWDRERAQRYWRTHHAGMGRRVPSMPLYLQNHLVEPVGPRSVQAGSLAFDGFSVCWFEGEDGFRRCIESPEMLEMDEDAERVFVVDEIRGGWSARLEETVTAHVDTPEEELFKVGWIGRYRPGRDRDEAHRAWTDGHRALLDRVPGLLRHAQNHAAQTIGPEGFTHELPLAFDGIAEFWFQDRPSYREAMASPEWEAVLEDADGLFDLGAMWDGGYAGVVDHLWINRPERNTTAGRPPS